MVDEHAIQRLVSLGFELQPVRDMYLACDRNEVLAAWNLIESAGNARRVARPPAVFEQLFASAGFPTLANLLSHNAQLLAHIVPELAVSHPELAEAIESDRHLFLQMVYIWQARRRHVAMPCLRSPSNGDNQIFEDLINDPSFREVARFVLQHPDAVSNVIEALSENYPELSREIASDQPRFFALAHAAVGSGDLAPEFVTSIPPTPASSLLLSHTEASQMSVSESRRSVTLAHEAVNSSMPTGAFISQLTDAVFLRDLYCDELINLNSSNVAEATKETTVVKRTPTMEEWAKTRTLVLAGFDMHLALHASCFTAEDWNAMDRIVALGFNQNVAVQAYIECNKNEDCAVDHLFREAPAII